MKRYVAPRKLPDEKPRFVPFVNHPKTIAAIEARLDQKKSRKVSALKESIAPSHNPAASKNISKGWQLQSDFRSLRQNCSNSHEIITPANLKEILPPEGFTAPSKQELRAMPYREFLKSDYWQICRQAIYQRDQNRCRKCGVERSITALVDVHHLTYKNHGDEFNHPDDLISLCERCHAHEHGHKWVSRTQLTNKKARIH